MELNKNNMKKILCIVAFAIVLFVGIENVNSVLYFINVIATITAPFIIGCAIAFILNVPMRAIEKKIFSIKKLKKIERFKRPISIVLVILLLIGIVFIVLFLMVPELIKTVKMLTVAVPEFVTTVQEKLENLGINNESFNVWLNSMSIDWNSVSTKAVDFLKNGAGSFVNSTFSVVSSIINGVMNFFIGFIFAIYILSQKEKLGRQIKRIMYSYIKEERVDRILEILKLSDKTFSNFLSGQCTEAAILGLMFFVSMTVFGFDHALLISVLIAFTALIPVFGAFAGCGIGAFLILMIDPMQAFWFIVLFLVMQQIEGNLIYPHVVGNSVGLPSIWVLFAVTIGASTMGIVGMLINIPLCSIIYALLRDAVNKKLADKNISQKKIN